MNMVKNLIFPFKQSFSIFKNHPSKQSCSNLMKQSNIRKLKIFNTMQDAKKKYFPLVDYLCPSFKILQYQTSVPMNHHQQKWKLKQSFPFASKHQPASGIKGSSQCQYSICAFTQFDPLKEIIVGHVDRTASLNEDILQLNQVQTFPNGPLPQDIVNGGASYLQNFARKLQELGINVLRVGQVDYTEEFQVGGVKTCGFCCFSPRDIPFVYHDSFFEFPSVTISRSQQFKAFEWIQQQLHAKGSKIYAGWPAVNKYNNFRYQVPELHDSFKRADQYFGDAANLLKLGLDILFLVSQSGSYGLWKLFEKKMLDRYGPKVRVHPVINVYRDFHIDTTFTVLGFNKKLGKYLVIAEGNRVNPTNMPAIFRGSNWAVIDFTDFKEEHTDPIYPGCSPSIAINFLVVNPHLSIISHRQTELKRVLQFYDIEVITIEHKYAKALEGGVHCSSNDVYREDVHGFSKIIEKPTEELTLSERAGLFDPKLLKLLEQNGQLQNWPQICNQHDIFPNYVTDHLSQQLKNELKHKHEAAISGYKQKSKE